METKNKKEFFETNIQNVKVKLYKTGMAILKNDDDTCDAIQETLISAYKNIENLKEEKYFDTWIIRIMINKCYDVLRKKQREQRINEKVKLVEDTYYEFYSCESELENILNKIDSNLRTVTVLYYYDELTVSKIAEMLNIPEGTVKSRLSRAREKLYEILKKEEVK